MSVELEDQLPALFDSANGGPQMPREVFRRLEFVARMLREAPVAAEGTGPRLLWRGENGAVRSLAIGEGGVVIGREAACDLILAGPRVSRRHCRMRALNVGWAEIEDLASSNGTAVNGVKIGLGAHEVRDGDVIELSGVALALVIDSAKG